MDLNKAATILEIDLNVIKITSLTQDYIKKQFHKLALINHPDKNGNSLESTNKFQQINEAYEYLAKELNDLNFAQDYSSFAQGSAETAFVSSNDDESTSRYIYLLSLFIGSIIDGQYKEAIKNVIKEIVTYGLKHCEKNVYLERIFLELDKDSALEVFNFICKYKHILHINSDTLEFVSSLIKQKYENDRVFILNPSITDLIENNIFKLYVDDQLYLVPLWHDELYFDSPSNSDIIVLCNPELPANMVLDEDNNLHVQINIEGNKLLDLIKNNAIFVSLLIGDRDFSIPLNKLHMKKEQTYKFVKQGISRVIEDDIYNVSCKMDIIVKIRIV
jgi:curved DNA-binding protein CbpA